MHKKKKGQIPMNVNEMKAAACAAIDANADKIIALG